MHESTTKKVPAADWDAGKFSRDEWELVQCTKCGDVHPESSRPRRSDDELEKKNCTPLVCPSCSHDVWQAARGAAAEPAPAAS